MIFTRLPEYTVTDNVIKPKTFKRRLATNIIMAWVYLILVINLLIVLPYVIMKE
jgi:hypothetical protein